MATEKTTTKVKKAPKKTEKKSDDFAIFETGGKQYGVQVGDILKVEKVTGDHEEGTSITFDKVLFVDNGKDTTIGDPYIKGASVVCDVKEIGRAKKVDVVKYKAKSRYFKRKGHRQPYFKLEVTKIA
tara:strand:- start:70 stop:450 length:381 start_codon:yes stop_codon:yes gene_type:complete